MLGRVAEHLSWRANQCNLAARAAKDADDEATDRLRTLQARPDPNPSNPNPSPNPPHPNPSPNPNLKP